MPYATTTMASVLGRNGLRTERFPVPKDLAGGGLLQVEAAAVCGSDWNHYQDGEFTARGDVILGHETAGVIVAVDDDAANRWGVAVGSRVYVEEYIACGACKFCLSGQYNLCLHTDWTAPGSLRYGRTPVSTTPGLWGGFAEHLYIHPRATVHRIPKALSSHLAVLANPVANGFRWMYDIAGLKPGERVAIVGPGPHGLGCAMAARQLASEVVVIGLPGDEGRLRDARLLRADRTHIAGENEDLAQYFHFGEPARGPDVVIDLTASHEVLSTAVSTAEKKGRIVVAGHKSTTQNTVDYTALARKELSLFGVSGPTASSVEAALLYLERNQNAVAQLNTVHYGLEDVGQALRAIGGKHGTRPTHAVISVATK